jgi:hypothetical protein
MLLKGYPRKLETLGSHCRQQTVPVSKRSNSCYRAEGHALDQVKNLGHEAFGRVARVNGYG